MVRAALDGEPAIKAATTLYLPLLSDQTSPAYQAYLMRAQFVEMAQSAHEAWVGFLFRKDPQYVFDDALVDFMDDATLSGLSFYDWLKDTGRATLGVGRRGTLIEWDDDAKRPYLAAYEAEDIINWKTKRVGSQQVLSLLTLREQSPKFYPDAGGTPPNDSYEHVLYEQFRVYEVLEDGNKLPYVRCQIWRKRQNTAGPKAAPLPGQPATVDLPGTGPTGQVNQNGTDWIMVDDITPARGGVPLARINFVFHGPNNFLPHIDRAPVAPVARVNLSHYRTSADWENGLHFSGLPQAWAKGFGEDGDKMPVGSNVAWVSDKDYAACGYMEVSGGFDGLEKALERKEQHASKLGARLFDSMSKGRNAEAYDTLRIRQTGETVTLTNVAIALTQSGSKVLQWAGWWLNRGARNPEDLSERFNLEVSTDFVEVDVPSDKMSALLAAWQAKGISHKTYFYNLNKGELYPPDTEYEQELQEIQDDPVGLPDLTQPGQAFGGGQIVPPVAPPVDPNKAAALKAQEKAAQIKARADATKKKTPPKKGGLTKSKK